MIGSGWLKLALILAAVGVGLTFLSTVIRNGARPSHPAPASNCGHFERSFLNLPDCDR